MSSDVLYPRTIQPKILEPIDFANGEFLAYVHGRLESEPLSPPSHMILHVEPLPSGIGYGVKKVLAACTSIAAATAAGSLLSGKALER